MRSSLQEAEEIEQSDTEITLGMKSLLGVFFGLVLICAVFFGLGYSLGHGNSSVKAAQPALTASKPAAPTPIGPVVHQNDDSETSTYTPGPDAREPITPADSETALSPKPTTTVVKQLTAEPEDKPVTTPRKPTPSVSVADSEPSPPKPITASTPTSTAPASAQPVAATAGTPSMVQVAAISRPEDAEILVGALKKRGYSAVVRNDPKDSLLHVQIGPFASRDEARAMRAKLLADGYNAILK
ncbi:MAG: SPOR domain-containing protein [Acidobacteriaceae bacterium]|nr:SPOR domain-containing protein [Acidobacteriaceae bacterium]